MGGDTFLIPATAAWWLDHYREFARYLAARFEKTWDDDRCIIFRLRVSLNSASKARADYNIHWPRSSAIN